MPSLLLLGAFFLAGCSQKSESQVQSNTQLSEQAKAQNEEARLKTLAGGGELIKMTEQDKKDIADWVAKYKENKNTAFEKVDIDWNYDDPAGVWFAQKELGFHTVINPPVDLEKNKNKTDREKEAYDKESHLMPFPYDSALAKNVGLDLFKKTKYSWDELCKESSCHFPEVNSSKEELEKIFSSHISNLNKAVNIFNQYYPSRVPKSEFTDSRKADSFYGYGIKGSKINDVVYDGFSYRMALIRINKGGSIIHRIDSILREGNSNIIYEFAPLTQEGDTTSYFSESKYYDEGFYKKTLIAGQIRIKATTFEKVDENYIKKTVKYIDFLNKNGSSTYPFLAGAEARPELLYYGPADSGNFFDITYQNDNPN